MGHLSSLPLMCLWLYKYTNVKQSYIFSCPEHIRFWQIVAQQQQQIVAQLSIKYPLLLAKYIP